MWMDWKVSLLIFLTTFGALICAQEVDSTSPAAETKPISQPATSPAAETKPISQPATSPSVPVFPAPMIQEIDEDEFDFLQDPIIETQDVESFYGSYGFNIIPRKKHLSIRNLLRNSIHYSDNIYYSGEGRYTVDDVVYSLFWKTEVEFKPIRQLMIDFSAGFSFEQYFETQENKILPSAELEIKYKEGYFFANFKDKFFRNTALITGEVNVFSPWIRNHASLAVGMNYKRWLFEVNTFHELQDYEDFQGDYQFYGQTYTIGYQVADGIYATVAFRWDEIEYTKAVSIYGKKLKDTQGQSYLVGVRLERVLQLTKNMGLQLSTGLQERDGEQYWGVFCNFDWKFMEWETRRLKVEFNISQQTQPSLLGNFRYVSTGNIALHYLFTRNLAGTIEGIVSYNDPIGATTSMNYVGEISFTYRIVSGVDWEVFYRYNTVKSKDSRQQFDQNTFGTSVMIIF